MFIVNVWEDAQWNAESIHTTAEAAESFMIEQCIIDERQREVRRLTT